MENEGKKRKPRGLWGKVEKRTNRKAKLQR